MLTFENLLLGLWLSLFCMTLLWLISLLKKDASLVDIFWGLGFIIVSFFYFNLNSNHSIRRLLVIALVFIWGLRLSLHILRRNWGRGEDPRYRTWRERGGKSFWWKSYFKVFLLQGLVLWIVSLPLLAAQQSTKSVWTIFDAIGIFLWSLGFGFEAIGDWQLARFKRNPTNKGKVMRAGLWAYTRHPNYFGEALIWWGFYALALNTPSSWWMIISPLLMTFLLMRVSGVAMLEKSLVITKPEYKKYIESTNAFFPWFPRHE
jgi:steroid 5-alpha reductase family enzyme